MNRTEKIALIKKQLFKIKLDMTMNVYTNEELYNKTLEIQQLNQRLTALIKESDVMDDQIGFDFDDLIDYEQPKVSMGGR